MKFNFFDNSINRFRTLSKKKSFKYGFPFLLFMFLGSFGVEKFSSLRYEFKKSKFMKPDFLNELGIEKKKVDLDEELEKYQKVDLNAWQNIRGPRPWEEPQPKPST
ncbi:hypothetical protein JTE90_001472 [Oedothorax gibbosus]|uniref:Cytochrome c oxidase assembly protein COX16 homolog, mitochondrial n=1 Tax=Oedothorax gibbosus TaxID=931172 RepID=A0AAV6UC40_9ARAC|nr:hypothetical protein JTE90_001472 [Oedothorax gibbosus]